GLQNGEPEPLRRRFAHGWTALLLPGQLELLARVACLCPGDLYATALRGERAVLDGVGHQLMQDERQRLGELRHDPYRRARDLYVAAGTGSERRQGFSREVGEIGAIPGATAQQ